MPDLPNGSQDFTESELEEFRRMGEEADRIAMPLFLKQFSFREDAGAPPNLESTEDALRPERPPTIPVFQLFRTRGKNRRIVQTQECQLLGAAGTPRGALAPIVLPPAELDGHRLSIEFTYPQDGSVVVHLVGGNIALQRRISVTIFLLSGSEHHVTGVDLLSGASGKVPEGVAQIAKIAASITEA